MKLKIFNNNKEQEFAFALLKETFIKLGFDLKQVEEDKRICLTYNDKKESLRFSFGWINWLILGFSADFVQIVLLVDDAEKLFKNKQKHIPIPFKRGVKPGDPAVSIYRVDYYDLKTYPEIKNIFFKTLDYILTIKNIQTHFSTPLRKFNNNALLRFVIKSDEYFQPINFNTSIKYQVPENYLDFDPQNDEDARQRIEKSIVLRQGQPKLRKILLEGYSKQCCISGCCVDAILEAAHIMPYRNDETNHPSNALLLRADLHTLFDRNLIGINPTNFQIKIHTKLLGSEYEKYENQFLKFDHRTKLRPSLPALQRRYSEFMNNLKND